MYWETLSSYLLSACAANTSTLWFLPVPSVKQEQDPQSQEESHLTRGTVTVLAVQDF